MEYRLIIDWGDNKNWIFNYYGISNILKMSYAELEDIDKEFTNMVMKFELNNNGLIQDVINKLRHLNDLLEVTATIQLEIIIIIDY